MELATIKDTVQTVFGLNILQKTRTKNYMAARVTFAKLAREFTNISLEEIGNYIKKDHATIVHYCNKYQWYSGDQEQYEKCLEILEAVEKIGKTDLDDYLSLSEKYLELRKKHEDLIKNGHSDAEGNLLTAFRQLPDTKKIEVLTRVNATLKIHRNETAA